MKKTTLILLSLAGFILLSSAVLFSSGLSLRSIELIILAGISSAAAAADILSRRIPNRLIIGSLFLKLCAVLFRCTQGWYVMSINSVETETNNRISVCLQKVVSELFTSILTAGMISVPVLILVLLTDRILKKETMGGGDLKLIFILSMFSEFNVNLYGLLYACVLGILTVLIFPIIKPRQRTIPFGPALVLGWFLSISLM